MPLNHTTNANAVPTRLRYANPATFRVERAGGAPSIDERQGNEQHAAEQQLPCGRGEPVRRRREALREHDARGERHVGGKRGEHADGVDIGVGPNDDESDADGSHDADRELASARVPPRDQERE